MMLFCHKTGTMQGMLVALGRGYYWHVSGTASYHRSEVMIEKFERNYAVNDSPMRRLRRRNKGQANARLFVHPSYPSSDLNWWIPLTDGEHRMRGEERGLEDGRVRRRRLTFMGEYEAVRQPAKGGAVAWTWCLAEEFLRNIEASVRDAIRHRRDGREVARAIELYHRLPGLRGVRHQVASLRRSTIAEWKRARGEGRCPHLPPRVQPYVRYRSYAQVDLALVPARLADGLPPFAWEWRYPAKPALSHRGQEAPSGAGTVDFREAEKAAAKSDADQL